MSDAAYELLAIAGETLTDVERVRIATENRRRALTHPDQNINLPEDHPAVKAAEGMAVALGEVEKTATLVLQRAMRETPLAAWAKAQIGLGEKQLGRLLAVIGHPVWRYDNDAEEWRPRSIAQLWSYCGYAVVGGVAPSRKRGEQSRWNDQARMRCFLIAESCMKQMESPYRVIYDEGRAKYAEATHSVVCKRCGPSGKPAEVGSDLSDGHKHARALRLVAKAVLKDLWIAADDQVPAEAHPDGVVAPAEDRELVAA